MTSRQHGDWGASSRQESNEMHRLSGLYDMPIDKCWISTSLLVVLTTQASAVTFVVRKANGSELRSQVASLDKDWTVGVGKPIARRLAAAEWLSLRQADVTLPLLPTEEQIVLTSGDRIPVRHLRLDDEKLRFRHADLNDGKEVGVPLASVAMIWRMGPDGTVDAVRRRQRLLHERGKRDRVLLRNGDAVEGTLNALSASEVEVEVARKNVAMKWPQVAAVLLSSELADKRSPRTAFARIVLSATARLPGGRFTVVAPSCDGETFVAQTLFGATLSVPLERLVALELYANQAIALSDQLPNNYVYTPYLDEKWPWRADANAIGGDLRLGGSAFAKGIGMHADSRLTYALDGKYRRFDALVGLDDVDGRAATSACAC